MARKFVRHETVEAEQLTNDNAEELAEWCNGTIIVEHDKINHTTSKAINYPTLRGNRRVSAGQFLVKTSDGFLDEPSSAMDRVFGPRKI